MQHHAGDLDAFYRARLLPAIGLISQNWMAQGCQMDAELVGPACAWVQQAHGRAQLPSDGSTLYSVTDSFGRAVWRRTFFRFLPVTANRQLDQTHVLFSARLK